MMQKIWHDTAWEDYEALQSEDKKILKKVNSLLKDIDRNGYNCKGKPNLLREIYQAIGV